MMYRYITCGQHQIAKITDPLGCGSPTAIFFGRGWFGSVQYLVINDKFFRDSNKVPKEFKVSKAPWDVSSAEAVPSLSGGLGGVGAGPVAWGPKARR